MRGWFPTSPDAGDAGATLSSISERPTGRLLSSFLFVSPEALLTRCGDLGRLPGTAPLPRPGSGWLPGLPTGVILI